MTEKSEPRGGDDFERLIESIWSAEERGTVSFDPGVQSFVDDLRRLQVELGAGSDYDDDEIADRLDQSWEELVGEEATFWLTADISSDYQVGDDDRSTEDMKLARAEVSYEGFLIDEGQIGMMVCPVESDDETYIVLADQIHYIEPNILTTAGTLAIIEAEYPKLAKELEMIPNSSEDDHEILYWLQGLSIDLYPERHLVEIEQLADSISRLLQQALEFDSERYQLVVDGQVESIDSSGKVVSFEFRGSLASAQIDNFSLEPIGGAESGYVRYLVSLAITYPVARRGGGVIALQVPARAVRSLTNLRPSVDPTGFGQELLEQMPQLFQPESQTVEMIDLQAAPEPAEIPKITNHRELELALAKRDKIQLEQLTEVESMLSKLFSQICSYTDVRYSDYHSLEAAIGELSEIISQVKLSPFALAAQYRLRSANFVSSELRYRPIENIDGGMGFEVQTDLPRKDLRYIERVGWFNGEIFISTEQSDDQGHRLLCNALFHSPKNGFTISHEGRTIHSIELRSQFDLAITSENGGFQLAIARLEELRRQQDAAKQITDLALTNPDLALALQDLLLIMQVDDGENIFEIEPELIQSIVKFSDPSESTAEQVSSLLFQILGPRSIAAELLTNRKSRLAATPDHLTGNLVQTMSIKTKSGQFRPGLVIESGDQFHYAALDQVRRLTI